MTQVLASTSEKIDEAVRRVFGSARVRDVSCQFSTNDDGAAIAWVRVTYDATSAPSVEEMQRVSDAIWPQDLSPGVPLPVIDFVADNDFVSTAAE